MFPLPLTIEQQHLVAEYVTKKPHKILFCDGEMLIVSPSARLVSPTHWEWTSPAEIYMWNPALESESDSQRLQALDTLLAAFALPTIEMIQAEGGWDIRNFKYNTPAGRVVQRGQETLLAAKIAIVEYLTT